jgi:hypothetical protein
MCQFTAVWHEEITLPEFVDSALKDIDARLRELNDERSRLEAARAALTGGRRRPGRPAGSAARPTRARSRRRATTAAAATTTTTTRRGRPRGQRGGNTRANQALELVRKRPGITIPQLAKAMRIQPNYLYRVLPRLASDGQVKRDGQGWHPAS